MSHPEAMRRRPGSTRSSGGLIGAALRPLAAGAELGRRAGQQIGGAVASSANDAALAALDTALASRLADEIVDRILSGPELERIVEAALDSAAFDRAIARVIESRLLEETVERLLQTEALWLLVDEIAHSPAVAEAIQQQSVGFVDEVAGGVRSRSRRIDDRIEARVRRALGRDPRIPRGAGGTPGA